MLKTKKGKKEGLNHAGQVSFFKLNNLISGPNSPEAEKMTGGKEARRVIMERNIKSGIIIQIYEHKFFKVML